MKRFKVFSLPEHCEPNAEYFVLEGNAVVHFITGADGKARPVAPPQANPGFAFGHAARTDNPHGVTKGQIGLGNVDNTSDAQKPVSQAMQTALDTKASASALTQEIADRAAGDAALSAAKADKATTLAGYGITDAYTKTQTDTQIQQSVGVLTASAPAQLDTFVEAYNRFVSNESAAAALTATVAQKADRSELPASTSALPEGTNLYHTSARVNALVSAVTGALADLSTTAKNTLVAAINEVRAALQVSALRTTLALPATTVAGRLARFTDAAGSVGQTSGIFEDASGNVGVGTTAPSARLTVAGGDLTVGQGASGYTNWKINFVRGDTTGFARLLYFTGANEIVDVGLRSDVAVANTFSIALFGVRGISVVPQPGWAGMTAPSYARVAIVNQNPQSAFTVGGNAAIGAGYADANAAPANGLIVQGNVGVGTPSPSTTLHVNGPVRIGSYTAATVPSASASGAGTLIIVTDANSTTSNTIVAGGGSNRVICCSNGTNWLIA